MHTWEFAAFVWYRSAFDDLLRWATEEWRLWVQTVVIKHGKLLLLRMSWLFFKNACSHLHYNSHKLTVTLLTFNDSICRSEKSAPNIPTSPSPNLGQGDSWGEASRLPMSWPIKLVTAEYIEMVTLANYLLGNPEGEVGDPWPEAGSDLILTGSAVNKRFAPVLTCSYLLLAMIVFSLHRLLPKRAETLLKQKYAVQAQYKAFYPL